MSPPDPETPPIAVPASPLAGLLAGEAPAALREAAAGVPVHLVGGAVRDALLGRPARDLDAVVERDGATIAGALAVRLQARLVRLGGDAFAAWRVARRDLIVDVWDRQGTPLASDLSRRDATVNAMAVDLTSGELLDPCGGRRDLERRLLRLPRPTAFADDPLRVLRLARLGATLPGFHLEEGTAEAGRRAAPALTTVAAERVRVEFELALRARGSDLLPGLVELGLYPDLWLTGPAEAASIDRARGRLAKLDAAEGWLVEELLAIAPAIDRLALNGTVLALDLGAATGPEALATLRQKRWLSRRSADAMSRLLAWSTLPAGLPERRWILHQTGPLWPSGLLVAGSAPEPILGWRAGASEIAALADQAGAEIFDPPPLLAGLEVAHLAGLPPGPQLGRLVTQLRRLQIEGRLADPAAAAHWLTTAPDVPRAG